jgi:hypothetical protein
VRCSVVCKAQASAGCAPAVRVTDCWWNRQTGAKRRAERGAAALPGQRDQALRRRRCACLLTTLCTLPHLSASSVPEAAVQMSATLTPVIAEPAAGPQLLWSHCSTRLYIAVSVHCRLRRHHHARQHPAARHHARGGRRRVLGPAVRRPLQRLHRSVFSIRMWHLCSVFDSLAARSLPSKFKRTLQTAFLG